MGVFNFIRVKKEKLGPHKLFYIEYIGKYQNMSQTFQKIYKDSKPYFKFARPFGIYYDLPHKVKDPTKCRAVVGIVVNPGENPEKSKEFQESHIQYKFAEVPLVNAFKTSFPYRNFLTFYLFKKVYKGLVREMKKIDGNDECNGFMEIYYFNQRSSQIEFFAIKGKEGEKYMLSNAMKPVFKED